MAEYIEREELLELYRTGNTVLDGAGVVPLPVIRQNIMDIPAADVVSMGEYSRLLRIAKNMHLWIFLHTGDEQSAYDEIGLTDEENAMLGYGGMFALEELKEGADNG